MTKRKVWTVNSSTKRARALALGFAAAVGCTSSGGLHSRFSAVHNTMVALGLNQLGHLSSGSLSEGETVNLPVDLEARCYTFVAFGSSVRDIDVGLLDANNTRVVGDTTHDSQAAVHHCITRAGHYVLAVRMASGSGSYTLATWQGGTPTSGGSGGRSEPTNGTCNNPIALEAGRTVTANTENFSAHHTGQCLNPQAGEGDAPPPPPPNGEARSTAPEVVYSFTLERRQQVTLAMETTGNFDGALYLRQGNCEAPASEVACNDDEGDTAHSRITAALEPGQYFVFADGFGSAHGNFSLTYTAQDVPSTAEVCQNAAVLAPNTPVTGQLAAQDFNVFQARCGNNARGPERVYRLEVPTESRVQLHQESDYDGVLHIRRACADAASEVECNDDADDQQHSRINTVVPAGTYYVFSDSFRPSTTGNYTVEADVAPVAGGSTPGDTCADAVPLTPGTPAEGNTFQAHDDIQSPCASTEGYDVVYRLSVPTRSRVKLWFESSDLANQGTITVTRNCAQIAQAVCRPGAVGQNNAYDQMLDPGQYFVVVDSASPRHFGRFRLHATLEDPQAAERICRTAPLLVSGRTVNGTTANGTDRFQATCAGGAQSPENVYRLVIVRRSRVRLALTAQFDGALYLRQTCMQQSTERACNDDSTDPQHSLIETTLNPGTYSVFVDGYGATNSGTYTLETTVSAP
jgi:hypothetical protein